MPGSRVLVVVSYYDARPIDDLERLLVALRTTPAGWPFDLRVVVNRDRDRPLALAERHPAVEFLERPNEGYNIGAWEHGWRSAGTYDGYLFLQHECTLEGEGWLAPFVQRAAEPGVGLVGERLNPAWDAPWAEIETRYAGHSLPGHQIDGRPAERLPTYAHFFARQGIDRGARGDHLQTLVLFATRATLEAIGGFPVGRDYGEAIAAEIAISKRVQAHGLRICEVGDRPFRHVSHPQWKNHPRRTKRREPSLGLERFVNDCAAELRFRDRPWLMLGKGPSFAHLTAGHREQFHTFGLNHVVREVPLTIAHAIDVDVAALCADALRTNCRWLLMPRVPHAHSAAGDRLLEDWFGDIPVLDELDRQGRLVWYNLSTGRARPGSPSIEVRHFSSEAAMQILGLLGARTVRSLGIDGGRSYSGRFADLAASTLLANGKPLFDRQFEHLREIVAKHRIDWSPLVAPLVVHAAGDAALELPARVLEYSIQKHASVPVEVVFGLVPPPSPAIRIGAASFVDGDVATLRDRSGPQPDWVVDVGTARPWHTVQGPLAERWLDLFAEAVHAGVVPTALVRRAVRRGEASPALLRLPPPVPAPGAEARATEARMLARELANLELSAAFRVGQMLIAPVRAAMRLWS